MENIEKELISRGIIQHTGEINKDKINLISGTVTQPFVETLCATINGDMDTINLMTNMFTRFYNQGRGQEFMDMLRLLHGILGLQFSEDVEMLADYPKAQHYFLFSFLLDFDDVMQDYVAEQPDSE